MTDTLIYVVLLAGSGRSPEALPILGGLRPPLTTRQAQNGLKLLTLSLSKGERRPPAAKGEAGSAHFSNSLLAVRSHRCPCRRSQTHRTLASDTTGMDTAGVGGEAVAQRRPSSAM